MSSGSSFGLPPLPLASTSMTLTGFPMGSSSSASGPGLPQHHQQSQQHHQQSQQQPQQQQPQQQQYQSSALGSGSAYTDRHSKPGGLGFLNGNHHDGQNGMGRGPSRPLKRQSKGKSCMGCYQAKQRCRGYPCSRCSEKGIVCTPQTLASIASYKRVKVEGGSGSGSGRKHSGSSGEKDRHSDRSADGTNGVKMEVGGSYDGRPPPTYLDVYETNENDTYPSNGNGTISAESQFHPHPGSHHHHREYGVLPGYSMHPVGPGNGFGGSSSISPTDEKVPRLGMYDDGLGSARTGTSGSFPSVDPRISLSATSMEFPLGVQGDRGGLSAGSASMGMGGEPVTRLHSASMGVVREDGMGVPMINDNEPFCETLARHRAHLDRNRSAMPNGFKAMNGATTAHRIAYDGSREYDEPRPDLHSLVFNVKFRQEMKATFLAKSSQFQLRRMDSATFDAITRTETGAWSAAVAMIAYPWNPLWAKLHTLEERQQLFKLLEKEAMSTYHQIKTRPNTWLEALSAGILIVIALFEIGKYHTAWFLLSELHLHGVQLGLHRQGTESMHKGAIGRAIHLGPRNMRKADIRPDDGLLLLENDTWWNIVRMIWAASVGLENTDNPVKLETIWTPWPTSIGAFIPPPCKLYETTRLERPTNLPEEDFESQTIRLKLQLLAVYADVASLTLIPRMDGPGKNPPGTPLLQPADPDKYLLLAETHAALQAEVKVTFDAFLKSGGHDVALYDLWFIIVGIEIQLFIAEDGDQRNDRIVAACLRIAGMLSSLSSTHLDLCTDLDSLSSSTMHVLRTACRQETMRYGRLGLPKDALYDLLVIEASHIDQIMAHLSTTSPMASANFAWYQTSGISHFASDAANYKTDWAAAEYNDGGTMKEVPPNMEGDMRKYSYRSG